MTTDLFMDGKGPFGIERLVIEYLIPGEDTARHITEHFAHSLVTLAAAASRAPSAWDMSGALL